VVTLGMACTREKQRGRLDGRPEKMIGEVCSINDLGRIRFHHKKATFMKVVGASGRARMGPLSPHASGPLNLSSGQG
jgi:hypothetical protein